MRYQQLRELPDKQYLAYAKVGMKKGTVFAEYTGVCELDTTVQAQESSTLGDSDSHGQAYNYLLDCTAKWQDGIRTLDAKTQRNEGACVLPIIHCVTSLLSR